MYKKKSMVILFLKNRANILCKRKGEMTMRKWKLLLAGMMLMLSLSAVAGCGNNNANDKNNGTNGTNTSTENRLNNNADTTTEMTKIILTPQRIRTTTVWMITAT